MADGIVFDEDGLYIPQEWLDGVGEGNFTPISAERMNHIEQGIRGLSEAWDSQSQTLPDGTAVLRFGDIIVLTGMVEQQFATSSSLLHITAAVPIVVRKIISSAVTATALGDSGCEPHYTNCWANPTDTRCEAYVLSGISNPKVRMSYVIVALA